MSIVIVADPKDSDFEEEEGKGKDFVYKEDCFNPKIDLPRNSKPVGYKGSSPKALLFNRTSRKGPASKGCRY